MRRPRSTALRHWRQFWSITLPMALPFIMLAVLFRGIENFKMFDMVNLLTGGGPGSTTEVASITLKRQAFESWLHRLFLSLRHHPVRRGVRSRQHLRQGAQQGEAEMSSDQCSPFGRRPFDAIQQDASPARSSSLYALISIVPLAVDFRRPASRRRRIRSLIRRRCVFTAERSKVIAICSRRGRGRRRNTSTSLGPATGLLRRDHAQAQHDDRRPVQFPAALRQLA